MNDSLQETLQNFCREKEQLLEQLANSNFVNEQLKEELMQKPQESEYLVDRRIINNQIVQFASPKTGYQTKTDILRAMDRVMQFTDAEK